MGQFSIQGDGGGGFWLPRAASTGAAPVDALFHFILAISVIFFALIVGLMILFVVRYRRRAGQGAEASPAHNTPLEITWSVIPLAIVIGIFAWGFKVFMDLATAPANAYEVQVTAQKWSWMYTYPNGHVEDVLHVPGDKPVKLVMTSEDVIHSFFVPAFRVKRDVVPGRYSTLWFEALEAGEYQVYCTEYCGTGHSDMLSKVVVHPPGGFEKWLETASNILNTLPPAEAGERLYRTRGCIQCHSMDGAAGIGPTFRGVIGTQRAMRSGAVLTADENYIRESILEPQAQILAGFEPVMPTYKGRLKDEEITALIAFMKSLNGENGEGQ